MSDNVITCCNIILIQTAVSVLLVPVILSLDVTPVHLAKGNQTAKKVKYIYSLYI